MKTSIAFALVLIGILGFATSLKADDWALWRGPDRNGISAEKGWNAEKIRNRSWKKTIGVGYSSVTVQGDRVYTMGNKDNKDSVYCLDAKSGKEIWSFSYECSSPGKGYPGTRATPVLVNGMIYTSSREGHVHCLDAETGKKEWENDVNKLGAKNIAWGYSGSIAIEGELAIINAGARGIALDAKTGRVKWASSGKGGYSTPVVFNNGKNIAMFSSKTIEVLDLKTGRRIASYPWKPWMGQNTADPIVDKDKILISSGYDKGCTLLELSGSSLKEVWTNTSMKSHFSSPVLLDGCLYGVDGNAGRSNFGKPGNGGLVCLNLKDGKTKWREKSVGFGSLMIADGKIIYLNERGTLTICKASPSGFSKISSAEVLNVTKEEECWTMPVLANGRIFCRSSSGKIVCLDVK